MAQAVWEYHPPLQEVPQLPSNSKRLNTTFKIVIIFLRRMIWRVRCGALAQRGRRWKSALKFFEEAEISAAEFLQQNQNLYNDICDLSQLRKSRYLSQTGLNIYQVLLRVRKCLPCAMLSNGETTEREDNQKSVRNGVFQKSTRYEVSCRLPIYANIQSRTTLLVRKTSVRKSKNSRPCAKKSLKRIQMNSTSV